MYRNSYKTIFTGLIFLISAGFCPLTVAGQETFDNDTVVAFQFLKERGEVYFSFDLPRRQVARFSDIISIDNYSEGRVYAYAAYSQFLSFLSEGIDFTVYSPPGEWHREEIMLKHGRDQVDDSSVNGEWNYYPGYYEYKEMMKSWADDYPGICEYIEAGKSVEGRSILFMKISGNNGPERIKPAFMYSSTMHGDETVGFVLLLRLIEYLLVNYPENDRVKSLLDNLEIWINPLANPDGAFFGSDGNRIESPKRFNANNVDLNRDFPVQDDNEATVTVREPETAVMMELMGSGKFVLSANLHGGQEVMNYPWDYWERRHADDGWFEYICREYADTAILYSPANYMTFLGGVTNGYSWYPISGGRQDYVTYFAGGREVTMEISSIKHPPPDSLTVYWEYNRRSLLNYMEQAMFGLRGKVKNALTGEPLMARIEVLAHDIDNSHVYPDSSTGWYFRLLEQGTYDLEFSAEGYYSQVISGHQILNRKSSRLDVSLEPLATSVTVRDRKDEQVLGVFPLPACNILNIKAGVKEPSYIRFYLIDLSGRVLRSWYGGYVEAGNPVFSFNISGIVPGMYLLEMDTGSSKAVRRVMICG